MCTSREHKPLGTLGVESRSVGSEMAPVPRHFILALDTACSTVSAICACRSCNDLSASCNAGLSISGFTSFPPLAIAETAISNCITVGDN